MKQAAQEKSTLKSDLENLEKSYTAIAQDVHLTPYERCEKMYEDFSKQDYNLNQRLKAIKFKQEKRAQALRQKLPFDQYHALNKMRAGKHLTSAEVRLNEVNRLYREKTAAIRDVYYNTHSEEKQILETEIALLRNEQHMLTNLVAFHNYPYKTKKHTKKVHEFSARKLFLDLIYVVMFVCITVILLS